MQFVIYKKTLRRSYLSHREGKYFYLIIAKYELFIVRVSQSKIVNTGKFQGSTLNGKSICLLIKTQYRNGGPVPNAYSHSHHLNTSLTLKISHIFQTHHKCHTVLSGKFFLNALFPLHKIYFILPPNMYLLWEIMSPFIYKFRYL